LDAPTMESASDDEKSHAAPAGECSQRIAPREGLDHWLASFITQAIEPILRYSRLGRLGRSGRYLLVAWPAAEAT
jgi:hypothetical protein